MEVFEWLDAPYTTAVGWVVIDTVANSCSAGRLIITATATRDECHFAARQATLANAVATPHVGGAAAMIRFCDATLEDEVVARFLKAHLALLSSALVLVGENDAKTVVLDGVLKGLKLRGTQHAFSSLYAKATLQVDTAKVFGPVVHWMSSKTPISDLAQSFAACQVIACLADIFLAKKPRIVVYGFGAIGSSVAYMIENQALGTVVAIHDVDGMITFPEGLPISEILNMRSHSLQKRLLLRQGAEEKKRTTGNILCNLSDAQLQRFNASTGASVEAEFVLLCDNVSDIELVSKVLDSFSGVTRFVMPLYSSLEKDGCAFFSSPKVTAVLETHKVVLVPRWLCTSGKDQMMRSIVSIPICFESLDRVASINAVLDSISAPVTTFVQEACFSLPGGETKLENFAAACEMTADRRVAEPKAFLVVKSEERKMRTTMFVDSASDQANISEFMTEIIRLFRALFGDHNDKILLDMLQDLITFFLMPVLQTAYCAADNGERKNKVLLLSVLDGVGSFLKAFAAASKDSAIDEGSMDPKTVMANMLLQRPINFAGGGQTEAATKLLEHFGIPFSTNTVMSLLEELVCSRKGLVVLDYVLAKANSSTLSASQETRELDESVEVEEHKSEFGRAIGGIVSSMCEIAKIPLIIQVGLKAFLFFGGGYFLGGKLDHLLEPNILDDIALVRTVVGILHACQDAQEESEDAARARIVAGLEKLIPNAARAPEKIGLIFSTILGSPALVKELIYFHIVPAIIKK